MPTIRQPVEALCRLLRLERLASSGRLRVSLLLMMTAASIPQIAAVNTSIVSRASSRFDSAGSPSTVFQIRPKITVRVE